MKPHWERFWSVTVPFYEPFFPVNFDNLHRVLSDFDVSFQTDCKFFVCAALLNPAVSEQKVSAPCSLSDNAVNLFVLYDLHENFRLFRIVNIYQDHIVSQHSGV